MTVPRSGSEVKYELLEDNKKTHIKSSHLWSAILLVILVICTSIIALYTTWQHMLNASKEKENLDFLMVGPTKSSAGHWWMSRYRGKMYGLAVHEMSQAPWTEPRLEASEPSHEEPVEYKRVCYYNLGSNSFNQLTPDMISPYLCTHINLAFATVLNGTLQPNNPDDVQNYKNIAALKRENPKLKVVLSVEWFTSSGEFAWVVSSMENRTLFVDSAVKLIEDNGLDGLDIDWEFPSWPTVVQNQTNCFMALLELLSEQLHARKPPLILSVAAGAPKPIIDNSYNITAMAEYIDYVNVMAYDYHMYESYLPLTGANAPLYARKAEEGYFSTLNLNWTVSYWLYKGMPASKIVIGIPTYGHSYTLVNKDNHGWEAPSSGVGSVGSDGFVAYNELCQFVSLGGVQTVLDYENKVPYAFRHKEWISYDNEQSVAYKAEFVKQLRLGGVMVFSLNTDDVDGACGGVRFPLTERVRFVLQDDQL